MSIIPFYLFLLFLLFLNYFFFSLCSLSFPQHTHSSPRGGCLGASPYLHAVFSPMHAPPAVGRPSSHHATFTLPLPLPSALDIFITLHRTGITKRHGSLAHTGNQRRSSASAADAERSRTCGIAHGALLNAPFHQQCGSHQTIHMHPALKHLHPARSTGWSLMCTLIKSCLLKHFNLPPHCLHI